MPVFDFKCPTEGCKGFKYDVYLPLRDSAKPICLDCDTMMETCLSLGSQHIAASAYPYTTRNITKDGSPIEVTGASHLRSLEKEHGVRLRDDAAFVTKEWLGYDMQKKQHVYKESSGVGEKGCWV